VSAEENTEPYLVWPAQVEYNGPSRPFGARVVEMEVERVELNENPHWADVYLRAVDRAYDSTRVSFGAQRPEHGAWTVGRRVRVTITPEGT
jgi:hypothetical protein